MANPPSLFFLTSLLLFLSLALDSSPYKFPPPQCHDDEASALLQFKQSLAFNMCSTPFDSPKLESWKMEGQRSNCCSWAGVECDNTTGHVISLELSNSCLYGALSFNTTLSNLSRLGYINLAYNNFRHSSIPSMSGLFPQLTYLDLSYSVLSGSIPRTISQLSKLTTLSLTGKGGLVLEGHTFEALVENLTRLEHLHLSYVDISSTIPKMVVNLSSLTSIVLRSCGLHGPFPQELFNLDNLKLVELSDNGGLVGFLPQFNSNSPLEYLALAETRFSGSIPVSIGNLHSLEVLSIWSCGFSGQLPTSLQNLTQLSVLDISYNNFEEIDPSSSLSWLGELSKLVSLGLGWISLRGEIPAYLANLTQLSFINLQSCHLTGPLPSWLFGMSRLQSIDFSDNKLQGTIPDLFPQLTRLSYLGLTKNNLSGKVDLNMFLDLESLTSLLLSENNLSLVQSGYRNVTADRFLELGLGSCNLQQFPYFLHNQNQLTWLQLPNNNIRGQIPQWIWNVSRDTLEVVDLCYNFLTGFESDPGVIPWSRAKWVQLNNNMFHGPLPLPSTITVDFLIYGNKFAGEISPMFCTFTSLSTLDLSNNNLSGEVPGCLANFTSLETLTLGGNNLHGSIPQPSSKDCNLKVFTIEGNNFDGKLPRSLANCRSLQFLNLANNKIQDTFPSWLGPLEQLSVLVLRSNNLYGKLESEKINNQFPKLTIIDISSNNLSGPLPTQYFIGWNAMKIKGDNGTYLKSSERYSGGSLGELSSSYLLYMSLTNKGIETSYQSIEESFVAIDFSGNRFQGNIPSVIGNLSGLRLLNLSNNILTGRIPSSLANLSDLEALDLSGNSLSGEIPPELARLTFLSFFKVSNNNLTGSIPKGNQFDNFQNDSYSGNPALCGKPLSKQCGETPQPPPSTSDDDYDDDEDSLFDFGWKPVAIGYGCGFLLGVVLGYLVYTWKYIWIVKIFGEKRMRRRNAVRGVGQWDENRRRG